ncbi:hypothetical protein N8I74_03705 [Chitiniphilus purpureus]|uniref:Uncharacterized protein n=1 Tax=Chitiniphilus purpureus TaxID=2981137 RepID=A0ABY6DP21_9NEIS|nr:hypothetical protein [Chitiniphilus sp. CD1]UXY16134.1 hypothetical protein N8I74_03705 [Chitiniphilus sp. CD1]
MGGLQVGGAKGDIMSKQCVANMTDKVSGDPATNKITVVAFDRMCNLPVGGFWATNAHKAFIFSSPFKRMPVLAACASPPRRCGAGMTA